jgi:hypothetical protein
MWASSVKIYLARNNLSDTIVSGAECSDQQKARALLYMRRHLNEDFKSEYNLEMDPLVLWQSLKDHFDGMKAAELPRAKFEWEHLYFSDFGSVTAYDSALRRIVSQLKLCDQEITEEEMIEKTSSTFPPSQLMLHRMLRVANYRTYSELISTLSQLEKDDQKLMRNHYANPTHQRAAASKRKRRRSRRRRSNN